MKKLNNPAETDTETIHSFQTAFRFIANYPDDSSTDIHLCSDPYGLEPLRSPLIFIANCRIYTLD